MNSLSTTQDKSFSVKEFSKITALFIAAILLIGLNASAQGISHNPTILKLNVSPMFQGEYGIGLEHKLTKRASIYGDINLLNKDENEISGKGVGTKVGLRYFFDIKRSYKKGRNKSKLKAFSGHYISMEGRRGRLATQSELTSWDDTRGYTKFALHMGMQRTWKPFFINAEFGPSWGSSDFAEINGKGYYTTGGNLDGRVTIGLVF